MDKLDSLVAAVRKIATERPKVSYTHESCYYDSKEASDGSVGCLIGQGLAAINWEDIYDKDRESGIGELLGELHYNSLNDPRVRWCERVQMAQDDGRNWAKSISFADQQGWGESNG